MIPAELTPSAARALELAAKMAAASGAECVSIWHLVAALWSEESHAAELLVQMGVTEIHLRRVPALRGLPRVETQADAPTNEIPHDLDIAQALRHAQAARSRGGDLGSADLLRSIVETCREVREWLEQFAPPSPVPSGAEPGAGPLTPRSERPLETDVRLEFVDPRILHRYDALRILDAAGNRFREGLRTVEDYARFVRNDAVLSEQLKTLRHDFAAVAALLPSEELLAARDVSGDVGTAISTPLELLRRSPRDVAAAACKRLSESARTLEEYGKIISPEFARALEALRYRIYAVEAALLSGGDRAGRIEAARLYLLVTERACARGIGPTVRGALAGGVDVVQLREKSMPDRRQLEIAERIREWTHAAGALFVVNDRADLAALVDADGVHVGQDDLPIASARRILGPDKLVGVSTHTIEQARQAVCDGADYLGVGPTFPSSTKPFDAYPGLDFVRQAAAEIARPAFAIGGICAANAPQVVAQGLRRIAVSAAICQADDPEGAARELRAALDGT